MIKQDLVFSSRFGVHNANTRISTWRRQAAIHLTIETSLNLISFLAMSGAALVPFYVSVRAKLVPIRMLSVLFGLFSIVHGLAHLFIALQIGFAESVLTWSLSIGLLLSFGIYYFLKAG